MKRARRPLRASHRTLTREQELAQVICAGVHDSGCACERAATGPCSKMVWAARRAMKFLAVPGHTEDRQT